MAVNVNMNTDSADINGPQRMNHDDFRVLTFVSSSENSDEKKIENKCC